MDDSHIPRPAWAAIDLDALTNNIHEARRITHRHTEILAAVKADAYGHGAVACSRLFLREGADWLGVSSLPEALELRSAGIDAPILNLGYTPDEDYPALITNNVTATIYTPDQAKALSRASRMLQTKATVHVKVDTGMGRLGFQPNDASVKAIASISVLPNLYLEGIYSHFADSDEADKTYARRQFELFDWTLTQLKKLGVEPTIKHISNSAAVIDLPEYDLDMVRPGLMLYGYAPRPDIDPRRVNLKPSMSLKARLSNVKSLPAGAGIGYGLTFTTRRPSVIGTLPMGYADGYRRALSNRGWVDIKGERVPIVGRICMDQCMVDLTDSSQRAEMGDEATLLGTGCSPSVEEMAVMLDTIVDEVVCAFSRRIPRVYLKSGRTVEVRNYLSDAAPETGSRS